MAYFFLLVKECGIFSIIPEAIKRIEDASIQNELKSRYGDLLV
jgi:hypothetical protein